MNHIKKSKKTMLLLFLPIGILLFYLSSCVPDTTERIYATGIYKPLGQYLSLATGLIPFSIAEFIIISLVLFFFGQLIKMIIKLCHPASKRKTILFGFISSIVITAGIIYFGFVMLWGLNYNRLPFSSIANLDTRPASVEELAQLCEYIIDSANDLRPKVTENAQGVMCLAEGKQEALRRASEGYVETAKVYPELGGQYGNPKGVLFSKAMSYTGISGVYFPFTSEANVNMAIPDTMVPYTAAHEMAHQRGFAREDEANYIAYLTCTMHPDVDFQYSGTVLALIYAMNALYDYDQDKYKELRETYHPGVTRDLREISRFWRQYEGPVEEISSSVNNAYLKANKQEDGIHSYGRMIDLLIAQQRRSSP